MILQALKEYYDRKSDLPRLGFERKEIPFVITLKADGTPVGLEETTEGEGKARRAKAFTVPLGVKRASGIAANLLWDNPEYALGVRIRSSDDRVAQQHAAFKRNLEGLPADDEGVRAVCRFLERDAAEQLEHFADPWKRLLESGSNLTFRLAGDPRIVPERPAVMASIAATAASSANMPSLCLITGERGELALTHTAIKGVWGAQTSGANIVSFNQTAFCSFGREQGANAPIGDSAAFAYTTALNHLLAKDSRQRMQVGDASTVFWSAIETDFEKSIADFFGEPPKDDPARGARAVESLFKSVQTGALDTSEGKSRFYVLGLAPNAARISVRFWIVGTVSEKANRFCAHFEDVRIVHGPRDRDALSLFRLLAATALLGKAENIPPNVAGDTMRAILEGTAYPRTLLQAAVRRARAEREVTYPRAALIKGCLNRQKRFQQTSTEEDMTVSLDPSNKNVGYRLGRLFAALEKIQSEANPGINATIRDRFYGSASSTPVTVFGNLMRLKNHHLAKLASAGRRVQFERLLGEIMTDVADFPAHLRLDDQGRFAIGYYHQMQDFFTSKTANQPKGE